MKILIIEDETAAARNLTAMIKKILPEARIIGTLDSIAESIAWFEENETPDLLFLDIHLADGEAFRIFDMVQVECPIIFTTAYDEYALEAFRVNSIDYLLKPIKESELERAVEKLRRLTSTELDTRRQNINTVVDERREQNLFLIPVRDRIVPVKCKEIAYFYTVNEKVELTTFEKETYHIDRSLDKLSKILRPSDFFRANRQFIVAREAIKDISVWFGSRLSLNLKVKTPERIIISKERVPEFKRWFTGM